MFVTAYTPSSPLFRCDVVRRVGLAIRAWTDVACSILAGWRGGSQENLCCSEGCESRLVELRDTKARAVS